MLRRAALILCFIYIIYIYHLEPSTSHGTEITSDQLPSLTKLRGLKQDYGQFTAPVQNTRPSYGGWGGKWVLAPSNSSTRGNSRPGSRSGSSNTNSRGRARSTAPSAMQRPTSQQLNSAGSNTAQRTNPARVATPPAAAAGARSNTAAAPGVAGMTVGSTTITPRGGNPRVARSAEVSPRQARFNPITGTFTGGNITAAQPIKEDSNMVFLTNSNATKGSSGNTTTTVDDPDPVEVERLPANVFEAGYCIPRRQFLVTNVTARSCNPGSNLTTWDGEPVCARLECQSRPPNTNVMSVASGCRTVVQRPRSFCPSGCNLIEQRTFNASLNRTQLFTKCSCPAGSQQCPARWTACICFQPLSVRNETTAYVVCSETQAECNRKCALAPAGSKAPLCLEQKDPFLSSDPIAAPSYPGFAWNLAAQGRATAVTASGVGRSLLQLLSWAPETAVAAAKRAAVFYTWSTNGDHVEKDGNSFQGGSTLLLKLSQHTQQHMEQHGVGRHCQGHNWSKCVRERWSEWTYFK